MNKGLTQVLLISAMTVMINSPPSYAKRIQSENIRQEILSSNRVYLNSMYDIEQEMLDYQIREEEKRFADLIKNATYYDGWTKTSVNVRSEPNTNSDILDVLKFNTKISYTEYNGEWVRIKYKNDTAFVSKKYISNEKCKYQTYSVPDNNGFKSYMPYQAITAINSPQHYLQHNFAYTGNYGIRQIDGRYCVAIGSHFTSKIGQYFDLVLKNGTIIPCVLADQKADEDTDSDNIMTEHNGCVSEFIVNVGSLNKYAKRDGNISSCTDDWNSPVVEIRVYQENILNK